MRGRLVAVVLSVVMLSAASGCKKDTAAPGAPPAAAPPAKAPVSDPPECAGLDETNLGAVAACYWKSTNPDTVFRLWSAAKQKEEGEAGARKAAAGHAELVGIRTSVAKEEVVSGTTYAAGAHSFSTVVGDGGVNCSATFTNTWVREEKGWRLHGGFKVVEELANKKFNSGDYSGAAETAEEWLKIDPLSVDAYKRLGFAVDRGAKGKSLAEVSRALLAINPNDSDALFAAVSFADDPDVAAALLSKMAPDDCSFDGALGNVVGSYLGSRQPKSALDLLDKYEPGPKYAKPGLLLRRVDALRGLRRAKDVPPILDTDAVAALKTHLDRNDPSFAAGWSAILASAMIDAERPDAAKEWVTFGLMKDPNDEDLARVLKRLKKK